jgi:hypothetical protein
LAAALAGLRSGVVPHQGLTNTELLGFDDFTRTVIEFNEDQLNIMAEQGVWIVTQSVIGATPYVRHQLTTDSSSLNKSEDSITTNVDSISYGIRRRLAPFIGTYNRHPESIVLAKSVLDNELRYRQSSTYTVRAGNQLLDYKIVKFEPNVQFKDRLDVEVRLEVPYPYNYINITLVV